MRLPSIKTLARVFENPREAGLDCANPDWDAYEKDDNKAGRLYKGADNEIYYYLGD